MKKTLLSKVPDKMKSMRIVFMAILIGVCSIVIVLSATGSYFAYKANLLDVIGTARSSVLSQLGDVISRFKSNSYTVSNLYYNDPTFRKYVLSLNDDNYDEFSDYMDTITAQYQVAFNKANLSYSVVYVSTDGIGYSSETTPENYDYFNPSIRIWYDDLYHANGDIVDVASYKDKFLNKNYMLAARTVMNDANEIIGYLMIAIDERQLYDTYSEIVSPNSKIYISDSEGNIITSSHREVIGFHYFNMSNLKKIFDGKVYANIKMPTGRSLFSTYTLDDFNIQLFEETPLSFVLLPIKNTRNFVLVISSFVTVLGVALAYYFAKKTTDPIRNLRDNLMLVENGNLDTIFKSDSYTEINSLNEGISRMLSRIKELMASEKSKEKQKRKIQYFLLQAQINPHYIYNTLFSIKCLVDMEENGKASEMLSAFIQLLKRTLNNPDKMSSVKEEIESLKQYVNLQKLRYGEVFDIVFECDENIENFLIPTLLIQPIVENSILHGIDRTRQTNIIVVTLNQKNNELIISVEDNGVGMSKERIASILNGELETDKTHIGIRNIQERINILFGENSKLEIESYPDEGTKITINIPIAKKDEGKQE